MKWVQEAIDDYYHFLKDKTLVHTDELSGWTEISTPFLDVFNDSINLYLKKKNGKILISDDGDTLKNLELSGLKISRSQKRKEIFNHILLNYGIHLEGDEMITEATAENFPQKKLNLLSAIAEANDLFVLAKHTVASVFREDVQQYLDEQEIVYTPYFISKGSTGLEFTFDFQVAYKQKEIVIKAFNSVTKLNLPHFLFTWNDIRNVRERQTDKEVVGMAVINDEDNTVKEEYLEALNNKGAEYVLWSERNKPQNIKKLQAA